MSELDSNKTIEQLLSELMQARADLDAAEASEKQASNRLSDARNVFNGVTKRLDIAYRKLRESAPRSTDWHSEIHSGSPV
jgi:hypothetical protein